MSNRGLASVVLAGVLMCGTAWSAPRQRSALLVVPAKRVMVQLARDAASLRPVTIVAYSYTTNSPAARLHVWRPESRRWDDATPGSIMSGAICRVRPRSIILVGGTEFPSSLAGEGWWTDNRNQVSDLNLVDIVNTLDGQLDFNAAEWKALAKRYRLKIVDRNQDRRKGYHRYDHLRPQGEEAIDYGDPETEETVEPVPEIEDPEPEVQPVDSQGEK